MQPREPVGALCLWPVPESARLCGAPLCVLQVKTGGDPEERTYEEWEPTPADIAAHGIETADDVYFLLNSTELRHVGFPMDSVDPLPAPPVRISARRRRSQAEAERPSTAGRRFRVPASVENQILALCW